MTEVFFSPNMIRDGDISLVFLFFVLIQTVYGKCKCPVTIGIIDRTDAFGNMAVFGKLLRGYNLSTLLVPGLVDCLDACASNCLCASMNYKIIAENNGLHVCDLNYEASDSKQEALEDDTGYNTYTIYSEVSLILASKT